MALPRYFRRPPKGRGPQSLTKVPFKEEWPLILENKVSTRRGSQKDVPCLQETFAFITCLKDNNNSQELCSAQGESVRNCYSNYLAQKEETRKRTKAAGDFVPEISAKDMDPKQLNKFLSHFPHKLKHKK